MSKLTLLIVSGLTLSASGAWAVELPQAELDKIEHLIAYVAAITDAVFVRNGREYDAATAAKFIRGKWQANSADIKTAQDFIDKAASLSSTTGKPYLIRFKDGKEIASGEYLSAELSRLEKNETD